MDNRAPSDVRDWQRTKSAMSTCYQFDNETPFGEQVAA